MQQTSELYKRLLNDINHYFEISVLIGDGDDLLIDDEGKNITFGGIEIIVGDGSVDSGYRENMIMDMSANNTLFNSSTPSVGNCISAEIDVEMLKPKSTFPNAAPIRPFVRVTNGAEHSEWLPQGVYFIDTRQTTKRSNGREVISMHGYDAMMRAEQYYPSTDNYENYGEESGDIDTILDTDMIDMIVAQMNAGLTEGSVSMVHFDDYDLINREYYFPAVVGAYSCREVLSMIGAAYCGNWIIDENNYLRLIKLRSIPATQLNVLTDDYGYSLTFGGEEINV